MPTGDDPFERLVQKFSPESRLLRVWSLTGGVSAQVMALEIERADGTVQKLIVRQHGATDRQRNPQIAADEFRLLELLHAAGLVVLKPFYVDASGELFATPVIVIEYVEGETEFAPADLDDFIDQCAAQLARIHSVDCSTFDFSFLPRQAETAAAKLRQLPVRLDQSIDEARIRAALEAALPFPQRNESALLHCDYWAGNLLWREGKLAAVIDWEDAALGDPLADVGNSRLELLWAFGSGAMERFTDQYQAMTDIDLTSLPCWDLYAALRPAFKIGAWAGDPHRETIMRERHRWFVAQAFEKLSSLSNG